MTRYNISRLKIAEDRVYWVLVHARREMYSTELLSLADISRRLLWYILPRLVSQGKVTSRFSLMDARFKVYRAVPPEGYRG